MYRIMNFQFMWPVVLLIHAFTHFIRCIRGKLRIVGRYIEHFWTLNIMTWNFSFLSAFAKLWKATISFVMRREEKPTRCHWMVYCTYNMLNMFRALLCPSSGAREYMCVITAYGVQCLVAGCRRSGAGQPAMRSEWGMLLDASRATSLIPNA